MTIAASAALMTTTDGAPVPLVSTAVRATLRDLLAEVTVEQSYRNNEQAPIEAVYSFPLPVEAVLLDARVALGGRELTGCVVARKAAERTYEEAVVEGDAAVMIERPEPGLYVMNLGNLLPGADATVRLRYALVLRRQRGRIRFHHPTTIAPRFGRWTLQPHQIPELSLLAEHTGSLEVEVVGAFAGSRFASPSHDIDVVQNDGSTLIRLRRGTLLLDRDFVLDVRPEAPPRASSVRGADLDGGHVCLAVLHPDLPAEVEAPPRDLKIVMDCSGSMQGDSIAQARVAVIRILERLRPQDRFTILLFGNSHRLLFPAMVPGDDVTVSMAQKMLDEAAANMGGTEMGAALAAAYQVPVRAEGKATLILITDGEITGVGDVVEAARASRHHLFPVGVGSAVAEGLLRDLARGTGGACELVAPREDMAERILQHFRRIDNGGARLEIDWPVPPTAVFNLDESVFAGDTAVVFARFAKKPVGEARVTATLPDGRRIEERVALAPAGPSAESSEPGTVARLAASRELLDFGIAIDAAAAPDRARLEDAARACAERYQLLSPWTNWLLVVAQANEQMGELPALRKVSQMLAAGWGGVGSAAYICGSSAPLRSRAIFQRTPVHEALPMRLMQSDEPRFAETETFGQIGGTDGAMDEFIRMLERAKAERRGVLRGLIGMRRRSGVRIDDLVAFDFIDRLMIAELRRLVSRGFDEQQVVAAFLHLLIDGDLRYRLDRRGRLLVINLYRNVAPPQTISDAIRLMLPDAADSGSIA